MIPIHEAMIAAAGGAARRSAQGGGSVRLRPGAEEAEVLRQAGIPFEMVPGVTAAWGRRRSRASR